MILTLGYDWPPHVNSLFKENRVQHGLCTSMFGLLIDLRQGN